MQAEAQLSLAVNVAGEHSIEGVLGVLALFSRLPLDEQGFVWLRMFAEQAAVAIANAQALEDQKHAEAAAQRSEIRLRTLLSANNAIISHLSENELLPAVSQTLGQTLEFDFAGVALYDPDIDAFRVLAVQGELYSSKCQRVLTDERG